MHKSQSNITIAMTEFDNLRELNAYAIDIARDYFAMAANDPRREENRTSSSPGEDFERPARDACGAFRNNTHCPAT